MESLELTVGPYTYTARADGPSDGPLVLLLHGFPETSYEWRAQLPALAAAGYRAVAPDQRGYTPGARPVAVDDYRVDRLVDDAFGFADALGAERFDLVGHDWGGFVAWYAAGAPATGCARSRSCRPRTRSRSPGRSASGGDQADRSSYMTLFRTPEAEAAFLDNDAAMLRAAYGGHSPTRSPSTCGCSATAPRSPVA